MQILLIKDLLFESSTRVTGTYIHYLQSTYKLKLTNSNALVTITTTFSSQKQTAAFYREGAFSRVET